MRKWLFSWKCILPGVSQAAARDPFSTRGAVTATGDQGNQCGFICQKVAENRKFLWFVYHWCLGDATAAQTTPCALSGQHCPCPQGCSDCSMRASWMSWLCSPQCPFLRRSIQEENGLFGDCCTLVRRWSPTDMQNLFWEFLSCHWDLMDLLTTSQDEISYSMVCIR